MCWYWSSIELVAKISHFQDVRLNIWWQYCNINRSNSEKLSLPTSMFHLTHTANPRIWDRLKIGKSKKFEISKKSIFLCVKTMILCECKSSVDVWLLVWRIKYVINRPNVLCTTCIIAFVLVSARESREIKFWALTKSLSGTSNH